MDIKGGRLECQWCDKKFAPVRWDRVTYAECVTAEMKQLYKTCSKTENLTLEADTFYKCPGCGLWSRGVCLKAYDGQGRRIKEVGGKRVVEVVTDVEG